MSVPSDADRPIRLAYLITDLQVGGVPLHLHRLATRMPKDRFQVCVISLADQGPVGRMLADAGVPVYACNARSPTDVRALARLWRLLRSLRPDLLHALLFHANMAARLIGPLVGLPTSRILCEIQTVEVERRWHLVVDNLTCRLCRYEIGNSPSVVDHLHRQAHIPRSRLLCQWGAVDCEAIASAPRACRADFGLAADEPVVIWVGRLDPVKGFEQMLTGFARFCDARSARLVFVGDGPYRPNVEAMIRRHGMDERILLLGQRSDVPSLLKMADVFLFCSRTEGMPNALLEAMAAGLPVVVTDVAGCRDVVSDGRTGVLVPLDKPEATGDALKRLLADTAGRQALGQAALQWVRANLDVQNLPQRWADLYAGIALSDKNILPM